MASGQRPSPPSCRPFQPESSSCCRQCPGQLGSWVWRGYWEAEFRKWLGLERIAIHIADTGDTVALFRSYNSAPILVMFYEMLVRTLPEVQTICWDLVVCDEAHRMIKTSSSLGKLACRRKLLLTGTPVQNDLGNNSAWWMLPARGCWVPGPSLRRWRPCWNCGGSPRPARSSRRGEGLPWRGWGSLGGRSSSGGPVMS